MSDEPRMSDPSAGDGALEPQRDPLGWERTVRGIVHAAGPELARRRRAIAAGSTLLLDRWARPIIAVAASLMVLAVGGLVWSGDVAPSAGADRPGLEEVLYPPVVARWIVEGVEPTVEDIAFSPLDW